RRRPLVAGHAAPGPGQQPGRRGWHAHLAAPERLVHANAARGIPHHLGPAHPGPALGTGPGIVSLRRVTTTLTLVAQLQSIPRRRWDIARSQRASAHDEYARG